MAIISQPSQRSTLYLVNENSQSNVILAIIKAKSNIESHSMVIGVIIPVTPIMRRILYTQEPITLPIAMED